MFLTILTTCCAFIISLQVCNTSQGITVFLVDQPHQVCLMAAILGSLVGSCAKKLQEVITEEAVLILGVKEDLRELHRIMIQIRCFLNDAEARRTEETSVNNWLGDPSSLPPPPSSRAAGHLLELLSRSSGGLVKPATYFPSPLGLSLLTSY